MPRYDQLKNKILAREQCVRYYQLETGRIAIPGQYWSLCGEQSTKDTSEINQLVRLGLIRKNQFYGVDKNRFLIKRNMLNHPMAHWFHGEWSDVIYNQADFRPSIVFYDSTGMMSTEQEKDTVRATLHLSPRGTFLFFTSMLNNPRRPSQKITEKDITDIYERISGFECCSQRRAVYVYHSTRHTRMIIHVFRKDH